MAFLMGRVSIAVCLAGLYLLAPPLLAREPASDAIAPWLTPALDALERLSIPALRERPYGSTLEIVDRLGSATETNAYHERFSADGTAPYDSFVAAYRSDGLRVFTRIDVPSLPAPERGYPVVIFVHGWYGVEGAPDYDFAYRPDSVYARAIDAFVDRGFLVVAPALRGHGRVDGIPADGIEFLEAWDNGSYISPMYYAIDVLNLLEGLPSLEAVGWTDWGKTNAVRIDWDRINISGHSQGGDAALAALAVSGEGSPLQTRLAAGSIWSGCIGPRFEQAEIYGPMATTLQAFMSGDGTWTGAAESKNGAVNSNFVFGFPSDWIATVDTSSPEWTWQTETWSTPTVADALHAKFSEMYEAVNLRVAGIDDAEFELRNSAEDRISVRHDTRVAKAMEHIGGYHYERYLTEPLHLHHSDQDYYSLPRWNADLASRIKAAGGNAIDFSYPQNNHSLLVSEYDWFSHGEVIEGLVYMVDRDLALFATGSVSSGAQAGGSPVSIQSLRRYATTVRNEFRQENQREPLNGIKRRVVSFTADGLRQYALILQPAGQPPAEGWPVLMMNHGYHPNPPDNGRLADGTTDRPGDYYRGLPLAFAKNGFLVVVPDYRGHNISEGLEFTTRAEAPAWYTRDVIAAFRALGSLDNADTSNVFMWGHSMGGGITVRALLALGDEVRGASIWSASLGPGESEKGIVLTEIRSPLNLHHATGDPTTPADWSEQTYRALELSGRAVNHYLYESDDHLFGGEDLERAIETDGRFFNSLIDSGKSGS